MSDAIITVSNLGKKYRLQHQAEGRRYSTFRDVLANKVKGIFGNRELDIAKRGSVEDFWALKEVSFEVKRGEVVGIIGRNGAGKSTLLKILSRITESTTGRVHLKGRVASLLEVGTGFHPELTGSENIFLNGGILGMSRAEIRQKFDEIVAFAEVEKFLDTPVKRYSSGMYVRLAFAVAAHLEPEILIVDEVLAVGDTQFQKKCLGKMQDVANSGRTVLFVSHNMEALLNLCSRAILLEGGRRIAEGEASSVVASYLADRVSVSTEIDLRGRSRPLGSIGLIRLVSIAPAFPGTSWFFPFGESLNVSICIEAFAQVENAELGVGLFSARGFEVASWTTTCNNAPLLLGAGLNIIVLEYLKFMLLPGQYSLGIGVRINGRMEDYIPEAVWFEVCVSEQSAKSNAQSFGGVIVPEVKIRVMKVSKPVHSF